MAISGRIKWARLRGLACASSGRGFATGRSFVKRAKREWLAGVGRLRMDLPGAGMVTADDDGEHMGVHAENN
jgi:hypothetical protein